VAIWRGPIAQTTIGACGYCDLGDVLCAALAMKCPAQLYVASPRRYDRLPDLIYPFHDRDILVTACGRLCLHRKRTNISSRPGGTKTRHQGGRRGHLARKLYALRSRLLRPAAEDLATPRQPVRHEVVTYLLGTICHPCVRAGQIRPGGGSGTGIQRSPRSPATQGTRSAFRASL